MTKLSDYSAFNGRHWETGSIHNYYTYGQAIAPHTGRPYSESLLLGISGGIVMGYFTFVYDDYPPQARLLTRNTFDPWDTLLSRLGVVQNIQHTSSAAKGLQNLLDTLDDGVPAIVWADMFSLPYDSHYYETASMWAMMPIVVYGHEADTVWIADRAAVPLTVTPEQLAAARSRVKKIKHRIITLEHPDESKLETAVQAGIWDTIKLFTEKPPKGAKTNFGFAAFQNWIKLLTQPKSRQSWAKEFPLGPKLYAGLTNIFHDINLFGHTGQAERNTYADFLDEASQLLTKPALRHVASQFRQSAAAWDELSLLTLPDSVPLLQEARQLLLHQQQLFLQQGNASLPKRQQIDGRLHEIRDSLGDAMSAAEMNDILAAMAAQVQVVHDLEQTAVAALSVAM